MKPNRVHAHSAWLFTAALGVPSVGLAGCYADPDLAPSSESPESVARATSDLSGTNLAGTNLAGTNLAGTNLAGTNLAGTNLAGTNLAGTNLAAANMSLGGTSLVTTSLAGTNLTSATLAGSDSGHDIHGNGASGLLYSGEDLVLASQRCVVQGVGGRAFSQLLLAQSASSRLEVALGKLPWGFASTSGGVRTLDAWEATVWGDRSYCTFVLSAPPGTAWTGVAGFLKGVFRWNAAPSRSVDISGIEASAAVDPTLSTSIYTYSGMMDGANALTNSLISDDDFAAGELALLTSTTNDRTVLVDFSAWVRDRTNNGRVLANVDTTSPPTYAEGAFSTARLADGTASVTFSPTPATSSVPSAFDELATSYAAYRSGLAPKPTATRCAAALFMNARYGEPIPSTQCDGSLTWLDSPSGYPSGQTTWASVAGTTAPMNGSQLLPASLSSAPLLRAPNRPIVAEVYTYLWEPNHELPAAAIGRTSTGSRTALGVATASVSPCSSSTDANSAFDPTSTSSWCTPGLPLLLAPRSIAYAWGGAIPITSYRLTSGSDTSSADPSGWTLQGGDGSCAVDSDSGWTTLDTRSGEVFTDRAQSKTYSFSNTKAYAQYRLRITASRGVALSMQLGLLELFDSGGPVTAPSGVDRTENGAVSWTAPACSTGEVATRAFDNLAASNNGTRWCASRVPSAARPVAVAYRLPAAGAALKSYRITSSADSPKRDPSTWTLEGCDGSCRVGTDDGWVTLDSQKNENFSKRYQAKTYSVSTSTSYTQYRVRITANGGDSTAVQVGEIELF